MPEEDLQAMVKDPDNDYIFIVEPKQSLVDVALFAQGLLRSKNEIWVNLPMDIQARIIRELKNTRIIAPYENHWLLYTAIIEAALLEFTGECDKQRLIYGVSKFRDDFGDVIKMFSSQICFITAASSLGFFSFFLFFFIFFSFFF